MNKLKITGIVSLVIGLILCLVVDIWYLWVLLFAPDKVVSTTFEVGLQTTVDGNTKYFMEINSYDNCFEVKYNYMLDENQEAFFSQGLQYYNASDNVSLELDWIVPDPNCLYGNLIGWHYWEQDFIKFATNKSEIERINYMSSNDYETSLISTNPIDEDTFFKIQIGEELYLMQFKGKTFYRSEKTVDFWSTTYNYYYNLYNVDWLNALLFEGISSLAYGTDQAIIFEFGDLFNYYYPTKNQDGVYEEVNLEDMSKITNDVKSYYSIKVNKYKGNIQKASDSLFNCVAGNSGFNLSGIESEDYLYGRTNITANNGAFQYVEVTENKVALRLKESFINTFDDFEELIQLNVLINLDELKSLGLEFLGFTEDSGLDRFNVVSCKTVETINGELVYMEVSND